VLVMIDCHVFTDVPPEPVRDSSLVPDYPDIIHNCIVQSKEFDCSPKFRTKGMVRELSWNVPAGIYAVCLTEKYMIARKGAMQCYPSQK
jgi:hypothetical protein